MKLSYNILITSFFNARKIKTGNKFSVARTKPPWAKRYKELMFLAPFTPQGNPIRLRNYPDEPIMGYQRALREAYQYRWGEISKWLESLNKEEQYVLCCWCPHSKPSKEQIDNFGSFVCHNLLLAKTIKKHRPDLIVKLDDEREEKGYPPWK